jgi:hypothetical protein
MLRFPVKRTSLHLATLPFCAAAAFLTSAGCGGGTTSNSTPTESATASVNTIVSGVTYDLSTELAENGDNTGSGVGYTFSITNNGSVAVTLPAYVDGQSNIHPDWQLTLDEPSGTDLTFPTEITPTTTVTIQPGATLSDSLTLGPQYYTSTGTYDANSAFVYVVGTPALSVGTVTLDVND